MVDGVNFNPFSGKVFTSDEIKKLDEDKDGKISLNELNAGLSWLSGEVKDEEGEIQLEETGAPTETDTAKTQSPAKDNTSKSTEYSNTLDNVIDSMTEQFSQSNDKNSTSEYLTRMQNIKNEFLKSYSGNGSNLEKEFQAYVKKIDDQMSWVRATQPDILNADGTNAYGKLKTAVQEAGSYISNKEKDEIADFAANFVINQLASGVSEISILKEANSGYEKNPKFVEAKSLIDNIKTSATPKEDLEKAKQLLTEMVKDIGVDKTADAVNNKGVSTITFSDLDKSELKEMVPGYAEDASFVSGKKKDKQNSIDDVQEQAKSALEQLRPKLLEQMKTKMGAYYDEDAANKLIDNAMYEAINELTDSGIQVTKKKKRSWLVFRTKSYEASLNIRNVVDTFLNKIENVSANKEATADKKTNPVSLTDVLVNSEIANNYQDNKTTTLESSAFAKLEAKKQINIVATLMKSMLQQQLGNDYVSAKINSYVNQAMMTTLDSLGTICSVNTKSIIDMFYNEFNKLYTNAAK